MSPADIRSWVAIILVSVIIAFGAAMASLDIIGMAKP